MDWSGLVEILLLENLPFLCLKYIFWEPYFRYYYYANYGIHRQNFLCAWRTIVNSGLSFSFYNNIKWIIYSIQFLSSLKVLITFFEYTIILSRVRNARMNVIDGKFSSEIGNKISNKIDDKFMILSPLINCIFLTVYFTVALSMPI